MQCLTNHLLNKNEWIQSYNLPPENQPIDIKKKNKQKDSKKNDDNKDNNNNNNNSNDDDDEYCSVSAVLSIIHQKVYQIIDKCVNVQGCDITEISNKLKQYSDTQINESLKYLIENAYIYTTVNNKTFKTS